MRIQSIILAKGLEEKHQVALVKSITDPIHLSPGERKCLVEGIDLLRYSRLIIDDQKLSFSNFFNKFIDKIYTDRFLDSITEARSTPFISQKSKKEILNEIRAKFLKEQWYKSDLPEARFLIIFCLYWWNSLAIGYIFEIEVYRDLADSGIKFKAHDIHKRSERFSFADLTIGGMKGDIKTSTYFFSVSRSSGLPHDFYITRYYDHINKQYHWFIILRSEWWKQIDGEAQPIIFPHWPDNFSHPVIFKFSGTKWIAVAYHLWKGKILIYQKRSNKHET